MPNPIELVARFLAAEICPACLFKAGTVERSETIGGRSVITKVCKTCGFVISQKWPLSDRPRHRGRGAPRNCSNVVGR